MNQKPTTKYAVHLGNAAKPSGFTLIELSIVLVVIGLLVGGVLVGRDLVEIARARALMSQLGQYEVAYNTFRVKYNCIPGDCAKAADFGLGPSGNGDKFVGSTTQAHSGSGRGCVVYNGWDCSTTIRSSAARLWYPWFEMQQVFTHLGSAGMVQESFDAMTAVNNPGAAVLGYNLTPEAKQLDLFFPKSATGKTYIIPFTWGGKLYLRTGVIGMISNGPMYAQGGAADYPEAALTAVQMKYIHEKKGYTIITGSESSGYSSAAAAGQRVFATGLYSTNAAVAPFKWQQGDGACFVTNVDAYKMDGYCDLLWQIN